MPEMNGWWNAYAAFTSSGKPRPGHSTYDFRQAWRRIVLILRGGVAANVDRALRRLGMPPVRTGAATLPRAPVAFVWDPQTSGDPNIPANSAQAYYPGDAYVDWVGTDFFSRFQHWPGLNRFYQNGYFNKPFAFGEWAIWGSDAPTWAKQFFAWIRTHKRVRMVVYYQGYAPSPPFELARFTKSRAVLRADLRSGLFAPFPLEWMADPTCASAGAALQPGAAAP
jgi:hypothetical protein